jgi:hypothetical protein
VARDVPLRIASCATTTAALHSLVSERAAALVASGFSLHDAIKLVRTARALHPPAEVVLITDDIDELKAALRSQGLYAEVLRGPARVSDLVRRLGAPSILAK